LCRVRDVAHGSADANFATLTPLEKSMPLYAEGLHDSTHETRLAKKTGASSTVDV
jgi:hypothetical protein